MVASLSWLSHLLREVYPSQNRSIFQNNTNRHLTNPSSLADIFSTRKICNPIFSLSNVKTVWPVVCWLGAYIGSWERRSCVLLMPEEEYLLSPDETVSFSAIRIKDSNIAKHWAEIKWILNSGQNNHDQEFTSQVIDHFKNFPRRRYCKAAPSSRWKYEKYAIANS